MDLETTAFWTYLRMTTRVCFLCEQGTRCDVNLIREDDFDIAKASEAGLTNQVSYLLAKACNACWPPRDVNKTVLEELRKELKHWKGSLPATFDPWASIERQGSVFRVIKYLNTWHAIAWQFFHAAEVLLAVHFAVFFSAFDNHCPVSYPQLQSLSDILKLRLTLRLLSVEH